MIGRSYLLYNCDGSLNASVTGMLVFKLTKQAPEIKFKMTLTGEVLKAYIVTPRYTMKNYFIR